IDAVLELGRMLRFQIASGAVKLALDEEGIAIATHVRILVGGRTEDRGGRGAADAYD
ncbi:MAG: hypothetical protein Q9157_008826, partial [Trypethelium eluteriae]